MKFIEDKEKSILLAAISREKRVIKEHPELAELIPVIEQIDYYFMYDRLFKKIYNEAYEKGMEDGYEKALDERASLLAHICKSYNIPLLDMNCVVNEWEDLKLEREEDNER